MVKEESSKRQRDCNTMHSYFITSQNSKNRSNLSGSAGTGPPSHSFYGEKSDQVVRNPDLIEDPVFELECTIELSILGVVALMSNSSAYIHCEDDQHLHRGTHISITVGGTQPQRERVGSI